ncbi:MAG: hypothetical protein KI786_02370 [Mameliella sp.]|nr:hypothetical protein [Phaeodactylibacter sp.]
MRRIAKLYLLFFALMGTVLHPACEKDRSEPEEEVVTPDEGDCRYVFEEGISLIYGTWEPEYVIPFETGDSLFYEVGEGHKGHMFRIWYADSFELRDDGVFDIFYTAFGKPCKNEFSGTWLYKKDSMYFHINSDTVIIPVLHLEEERLIVEDTINTRASTVIMRRIN